MGPAPGKWFDPLERGGEAQELLSERFDVPSDVWSITSYKALHQEASATEYAGIGFIRPLLRSYITEAIREATGDQATRRR